VKKPVKKQLVVDALPAKQEKYRKLQTYSDLSQLMEEVINGVLNGVIEPKVAHCAGVLTGYATNLLRESTGGKQKISVFLSNMQQVKVEMLSQDEIARFCQSSEEIQYEILKTLETRGGLVDAEIKMIEKKPPCP
jgi:hypothetical protein